METVALQGEVNQRILSWVEKNPGQSRELVESFIGKGLFLSKKNIKTPILVNLLPVVFGCKNEDHLKRAVTANMIARWAVMKEISQRTDLQDVLFRGEDSLAVEIMQAGLRELAIWGRSRVDSFATPSGEPRMGFIECNSGEPQGDVIISLASELLLQVTGRSFGCDLKGIFGPTAFENSTNNMIRLYQKKRSECEWMPKVPNIGFFAFTEPDSGAFRNVLSCDEALQSAHFLGSHGFQSKAFSPFDVQRFEEFQLGRRWYSFPVVGGVELHLVRRLLGEPFENIDLWERLKEEKPEIYFRLIGLYHHQFNPKNSQPFLMLNPFSSGAATSKMVEAIISEGRLVDVRRLVSKVLKDENVCFQLGISSGDWSVSSIMALVEKTLPKTRIVYPGQVVDRKKFVLKFNPLGGHSGDGVFVGPHFDLGKVPVGVLQYADRRRLLELGFEEDLLETEFSSAGFTLLRDLLHQETGKQEALMDIAWEALLGVSRSHVIIAQELQEPVWVEALVLDGTSGEGPCPELVRIDCNYQVTGADPDVPVIRFTRGIGDGLTNITGGAGGLAQSVSERQVSRLCQ